MSLSTNASVSIVIPTHNEGVWLQRTVDAVFANTRYHPFEVIVVDDGSTDGSCEFLEANQYCQLPVKRVVGSGLGVAGARNKGAEVASGEILVFLDAHVLPDPGWLGELVELLSDPSVGLAGLCVRSFDDPTAKGYAMVIEGPDLSTNWVKQSSEAPFESPCIIGCCVATRRDVFADIGGFDPESTRWGANDVGSSVCTWLMGYRCVVSPRVEVAHLFKSSPERDFEVTWEEYDVNLLRASLTLLGERRGTKVINCLKSRENFAASLWRVVEDPAFWPRRQDLRSRFVHDDDWYFARFAHLMSDLAPLNSGVAGGSREAHMMNMTPRHWVCPECGATNVGPQTACLRCQVPGAKGGKRLVKCANCGAGLGPGDLFCGQCGHPVASPMDTGSTELYDSAYFDYGESIKIPSAPAIADFIVREFNPSSVVDVGCGTGVYLEQLRSRGVEVLGIEHAQAALERSRIGRGLILDHDLRQPLAIDRRFDLAISFEVAEHLGPEYATLFVQSLCALSDTVLFTAAVPGQGGVGHINEQPLEYWISLFWQFGYGLDITRTARLRHEFAEANAPYWLRYNLAVFLRSSSSSESLAHPLRLDE